MAADRKGHPCHHALLGALAALFLLGPAILSACATGQPTSPATGRAASSNTTPSAASPAVSATSSGQTLVDVPFRLNWTLYGEHAFFFTALDKGFYQEQGLRVTINEGSGSANVLKQVGAGSDPIGYVDTPVVLQGVASGVPVKIVLVVQQKSPAAIIYREDNPIRTAAELRGKRIAVTAGDAFSTLLPALLAANNLTESDLNITSLPTPAAKEAALLQAQIDGFGGFFNDQPLRLMDREPVKLGWLPFFDHGVSVLSTGVVVNEGFLKERPEVVRKFLAASVKGIEYTRDHPDEAAQIFSKYASAFSPSLAKQEIDLTVPLLQTERTKNQPLGCMSLQDFQSTYDLLVRYAKLAPGLDPATFFTNDYLPQRCSA